MSSQAEVTRALTPLLIEVPATVASREQVNANDLPRTEATESAIGTFSTLTTRGGVYLGVRYALGVFISIGNMFVLTWWIGPHAYGIFVTAIGLAAFLGSLTRSGVDTYLVRRAAPPGDEMYHVASTLIFTFSLALMALGTAAIPLLTRWYGSREFVGPYATMLLTVPLVGLAGPPTAKLERAMNFRAVAQIELGSQLLALIVSLTLAWRRLGVWAPVFGHLTWQCTGVIAAFWAARFLPRMRFDTACAREMLSFGVGYTASLRTWQLRTLVNPLLVGRFAGSEGVAFVGLAIRIAEGLGFIRIAAARLAIAALSRLQENGERFRAALEKALEVQVLVLGPLLCGFALLGPLLVQRLMGSRWMPSLQVYPFIATGVLVNSVFNLQASALFVVGEQWVVLKSYASHVVLLVVGTSLLIPHFGLVGYGWADLAACAAYTFLQVGVARIIGISQRRLFPWVVAFTAPLFVYKVPQIWALALCLPLLLMSAAGAWKWSRASQGKPVRRASGLTPATARLQHLYTFLLKTRYRGLGYAVGVFRYLLNSRSYRLRHAVWRALHDSENLAPPFGPNERLAPDAIGHSNPRFHFSAAEIPEIVARIPDRLKGRTVAEAEKILQHRFSFRGEERVFTDVVDWSAALGSNMSWNWDLNRHRFFVALGTAYYYSAEMQYLTKLVELWEHWVKENPAGKTPAWKHPFEVAARLQNWIWAYFLLECSGECDSERLFRIREAIREHGSFLHSNLEYHWPNNHLLLEAKALFEYSLLFPQFKENRRSLARAERILQREVMAQILADGAHSELCSMYHRIIAGELGELAALCEHNGTPLPAKIEQRIASLVEFTRALLRDDGSTPLTGDSVKDDSYIRFDPAQQECSDLNYWVWRGQGSFPHVPRRAKQSPRLAIFPQAGYAFLRGSDTESDFHLTFDFGSFSRCTSANHGHCDALSFELYAMGRPVIVDPGVCLPWTNSNGWDRYFRSTAAHNTLMLDGKEQSQLCRYSDVRHSARTRLLRHYVSSDRAGLSAECIPYWAAKDGVCHYREVSYGNDGILLIHDQVKGSGRHRLDWNFQFAPEIDVLEDQFGGLVVRFKGSPDFLHFAPIADIPLALTVVRGQPDPPRGWISLNSAQVVPAYAALYSAEVELPMAITFQLGIFPKS